LFVLKDKLLELQVKNGVLLAFDSHTADLPIEIIVQLPDKKEVSPPLLDIKIQQSVLFYAF